MESTPHLPADTLAALAEGRLDPTRRPEAEKHLNACPSCFEAYSEVVELRIESEVRPDAFAPEPEWISDGIRVAKTRETGRPRGSFPSAWPRLAVAASMAVLAVAAGIWLWPSDRGLDPDLVPVHEVISLASHHGLVYPEADLEAYSPDVPYRSGNGVAAAKLEPSIDTLRRRFQEDPDDRDLAYWFVAALTEVGQLGTARTALDGARRELPGDVRLQILDGILAAREQDFERAQRLFEQVIQETGSSDERELAQRNLEWLRTSLGTSGG